MNTQTTNENPLGAQPVKKLLMQFAIPSIVAMLVSSLYNIVDQFFIGRNVGELGNAATNISFPLSILLYRQFRCHALWLWCNFNHDHPAVLRASAPFLWISRQCTFLCKNLHRHCCDWISFSDPHDRKRSSDSGIWQTKD